VIVEFRARKREMTGDGGNHHEKLELKRISCASHFTIADAAGISPDQARNISNMRSSLPNQPSCTPDFSYPLTSSTLFSSSSPISLFLVHNSTIIAEHRTKSSLSISPCHDHELTPSTAYTEYSIRRVQAFTVYSIHRVQHPPNIVCLPFNLMITSWPLNVVSASGVPPYMIDCHQLALHERSKLKSPCHIPTAGT